MRERSLAYQPALDGLRGVAVGGVLLFHGGHLTGGYLGVDAFFVLSGYLITSLLLAEAVATGTLSFANFYARRLRRLMPAIVLVIAFVGVYAKFLAEPRELDAIRFDGLSTLFYFANWRAIAGGADYWAAFRAPSPFRHTWSLAIEEQFYFVWPLIVWLIARIGPSAVVRNVRIIAVAGCAASFVALQLAFDATDTNRAYFGTDTRIASMFVGAVLATISLEWIATIVVGARRFALEVIAIMACIVAAREWMVLDGQNPRLYRGGLLALAIGVAVVIAAAVHPQRGIVSRVLAFGPLRGLGIISYGVYLWHWPIFVWMSPARMERDGWPLLGLQLVVTIAVALASYVLVEAPIRHGRFRHRVVWIGVPVAASLAAVVMVATTSGYVAPARANQKPDVIPDRPIKVDPSPTRPQRILVVGNSIGYFIGGEGFRQLAGASPDAPVVLNRGVIGCRWFSELAVSPSAEGGQGIANDGPPCVEDGEWEQAVANFRPDVVIVVTSEASDAHIKLHGKTTDPCQRDYRSYAISVLRDNVRLLHAFGAKVVLTTAATSGYPFIAREWYVNNECNNEIVRRVGRSETGAVVVDLAKWMCPDPMGGCVGTKRDVVMRTDLVHYRGRAAEMVATWILEQINKDGVVYASDPPKG